MLLINDIIVGFDDDETIEVVVGKMLIKQNKTLSTAESCTGGKIAQVLTAIAGASSYFKGSVVSYATEVKIDVLGIPESSHKRVFCGEQRSGFGDGFECKKDDENRLCNCDNGKRWTVKRGLKC